jgi:hypothetical protein
VGYTQGRGDFTNTRRFDATDPTSVTKAVNYKTGYNTAGSVIFVEDPLAHRTTISYSDSFSDSVNRNTFAYPTTVTDPDLKSSTIQYDFDLGTAKVMTDPKGATLTRTFDSAGRGRYRIAREDDFSLPDIAIAKRLAERTVCPVGPGDFNHDGKWYDLAVIIVDTTRVGLDRFGLVIFNRQKNDDETYVPYWLYKNHDLSKTVLNGIKDDLTVAELREDGSMVSCHVKWGYKTKCL